MDGWDRGREHLASQCCWTATPINRPLVMLSAADRSWSSTASGGPQVLNLPSYSGKQTLRWTFNIFSWKRSFLFRNSTIEVVAKYLWLQMLLNRWRLSCIRFCKRRGNVAIRTHYLVTCKVQCSFLINEIGIQWVRVIRAGNVNNVLKEPCKVTLNAFLKLQLPCPPCPPHLLFWLTTSSSSNRTMS